MLNFTITATHADTSTTTVVAHRGTINAIDTAFNAGVVAFADLAAILVPAPASAVTSIEFVRDVTTTFVDTDAQGVFDTNFAVLEGHFYNIYKIGNTAAYLA